MLIGFLLIFVADTKIIYGYNFVAPLKAFTSVREEYIEPSQTSTMKPFCENS